MNRLTQKFGRIPTTLGLTGLILALVLGILVAVRLITGRSLGLRSFVSDKIYTVQNIVRASQDSNHIKTSTNDLDSIIFLHHSTGANLIEQGQVRILLQAQGLEFWDHDYNHSGLKGPDGKRRGYNYHIPDDNTNPGGLYRIFRQPEFPLPLNAFSGLLQHDVIVIKSCFRPANNIRSEEQLAQYKTWYLEIRAEMDTHPDKVFVIITTPPLNPAETNADEARRAREFANWLKSEEFLAGHANVFAFDFFDLLAESDPASPEFNMLRADYRIEDDSHPNQLANETIGPLFADFLTETITAYRQIHR